MTTPTITLYPDTLPAKGQANAAFDVNVDDFLTWQTVTNGPELAAMITWTVGVRDTVLATALAGNLPPLTGEALNFFRVNAAEDGGEFRTPAQVLGDIGGTAALALKAPLASPALTGTPTAPTAVTTTNTTQIATTEFVQQEIAVIPATPAGVTVISTTVVSTPVASVDLTLDLATYTGFEVELIDVVPVSDNRNLYLRASADGGSTFMATAGDYLYSLSGRNSGGAVGGNSSTQPYIRAAEQVGSAAGELGVSGTFRVVGASGLGTTSVTMEANWRDSSGLSTYWSGTGLITANGNVDALRFLFDSGNIESGTFILRGIK